MQFGAFLRANAPFLAAGALLTFCSSFGQTFFISIFAGEIRAEFGLSHGGWGGLYTLATAISALLMVWAGGLTDRYRARAIGAATLAGLAVACLLMAGANSVWMLGLAIFALRFTGQGMASHIAIVAMARWFIAARGRALAVAGLGFAAGEAFLPLLFVALLTVLDWRWLWVAAALALLAALPLLARLLRLERTPQSVADDAPAAGMENRHWRRGEVVRHWLFWAIVPAILAPSAFSTAFFFQQVHIAEVKGWAHLSLVALFPFFTVSAIAASLGAGALVDRLGTPRLMPFYLLPMAAGFVVMSYAGSLWPAALALALMGAAQGANSTVPNAFWAEFYGTRHLGSIKALATGVMVFGSAIGPGLTGWLIDLGISFPEQMLAVAVYFVAAAALVGLGVSRARPALPPPAQVDV